MAPTELDTMTLADLGRFIAGRTGRAHAADIARSTAPQLRYDWTVAALVKDPPLCAQFTPVELMALIERIEDPARKAAALLSLPRTEGAARPLLAAEASAYRGEDPADVAICSRGVWYYGARTPTEADPTGLTAARFLQDADGDYPEIPFPTLLTF